MTTTASADALITLLDKQALHELVMTYCRAVDRRDFTLLKTVYHQQATEDRGAIFSGSAEGFMALVASDAVNYELTCHRVFNTLFVVNGNRAEGEIYVEAYHRTASEDAQEVIAGGRFLDRYEKRDNRWGIIARTATLDSCQARPVDRATYQQFVAGSIPGQPGPADASYQALPLLSRLNQP
jgi:hypothetical protein